MKCDEKTVPWPFRPDHITKDGDVVGLTGTGIITNGHLQGIQSEVCYKVGQPTTIIEFGPDGEPIRTDSPLLRYAIHDACKRFRETNLTVGESGKILGGEVHAPIQGGLCLCCDKCHASLLRGLYASELTRDRLINLKEVDEHLVKLYDASPGSCFDAQIVQGRLVVQYDCPLLGFRELLFPLLFEERVIGALFVGQITVAGREEFIERQISSLPNRFQGCFEIYLHQNSREGDDRTPQGIAEGILTKHIRWLHNEPKERIVSTSRYDDLIRTTIREIDQFEQLLGEEISHQRITYIRNHVSTELKRFSGPSESSGDNDSADDTTLDVLWSRVQGSLEQLLKSFSLRYALVFGVTQIIHTQDANLRIVAKAGRWKEVFSEVELARLSADTSKFPETYLVCSEGNNEQYLDCLQGLDRAKVEDFNLVVIPVRAHRHSSIAILVAYDAGHPRAAPENLPGGVLDETLRSFDTLVVSSLAAILARGAEDNAKKQLQYLGHEAGQLVAGLDWLRITYLENAEALRGLRVRKIHDLCRDLEGFIGQMSFFFDIAKRMGTDALPEVEMSTFRPFGEVLFKWKDTYRLETERKCLAIRVADLDPRDPLRPEIYADRFLFEQLVYNLVNNAEKYSHRGTKIDLDCKLESSYTRSAPHVLTVTNYGRYMAPGRDVYRPFVRKVTEGDVQGLGLGLYIAWVIVEQVHHGKIEHDSPEAPISQFNIPLIKPYVDRSFQGKDAVLAKRLDDEFQRLKAAQQYESIVAFADERRTPKYVPLDETLRDEIRKPTYKVTITATIPVQRRRSQ